MEKHKNELTGSFALNALDDSERDEVLQHAEASEAVRDEIDALQETAALLGLSAEPVQPPARVKANIMAAIRNTPQLPPVQTEAEEPAAPVAETPPAESTAENTQPESASPIHEPTAKAPAAGKMNQRMFALAAGVLLIASGVLTGVVVNQHAQQELLEQQLSALNDQRAELTKILTASDVKSKTQRMDDGARVTLAYSAAEGMMAVTTEGLPTLPSDKGYELWLISDTGAVSAGMVTGTKTDGMVMVSGSMEGVTHFGITVEPASGSPAPTTDPIMVQAL
ncbi:anti-sigma factor domain-containing protein [Paeniglutamicibacter sp. NPDC012692]|uniref:anti-sigma factor n=1 Tax=Paeniglutamicibacter sp. NPDC012692 TaxID=3364388 RepID=UPI0036C809C1